MLLPTLLTEYDDPAGGSHAKRVDNIVGDEKSHHEGWKIGH